jgi:serine/threonine-protein phosphatase 2A regulatory subunit A
MCVFADSIDDEDEVLLALAEELGNLVEEVGGAEHAKSLLEPLNKLASVEEFAVREKAVESLIKIADMISADSFQSDFLPLVQELAESQWPTSRTSASGLFGLAYSRAGQETQTQLIK